jgi:hypothetical protein
LKIEVADECYAKISHIKFHQNLNNGLCHMKKFMCDFISEVGFVISPCNEKSEMPINVMQPGLVLNLTKIYITVYDTHGNITLWPHAK